MSLQGATVSHPFNNVIEVLELLESDNSRLFKEKVLADNKDDLLLRNFLTMAFDPWKNWGVAKYNRPDPLPGNSNHEDVELSAFIALLEVLNSRTLTGNKAREAVEVAMSQFDALGQKWCERLLWRNLRCGVSATTINKIWPESIVPFAVSLAESLTTQGVNGDFKIVDMINYPVRVEAKLDGLRCIAVKSRGEVTMFTRSGTLLETMPKIKAAIEALPYDNFVLDGEAMGDDWNESASVLMSSKTKKDDSNIKYHVFDYVPLEAWQSQKSELHYRGRLLDLQLTIGDPTGKPFKYVKSTVANNETELRDFYNECLTEGYEGVMIKDMQATYQWKRSDAILKMKPVATEEGVIVGWHEANEKTKRAGQFGGFHVLTKNGVVTKVGGGYTDALKKQIQSEGPDNYIGRVAEVEHQPPFTNDGKLRFPVFSRFRDPTDVDPSVLEAYVNRNSSNSV
jgi:DNA ligase-1